MAESDAEVGILFSDALVLEILALRKWHTRRLVQGEPSGVACWLHDGLWRFGGVFDQDDSQEVPKGHRNRYGVKGGRLWVREAWSASVDGVPWRGKPRDIPEGCKIWYRADGDRPDGMGPWRPSIFMPRRASRIDLRLRSDVVPERLHSAHEFDAIAEGFKSLAEMRDRWDVINGAGSWAKNPWVWVLDFEMIKPRKKCSTPSSPRA